jgi:uncharacterized protein involved in type VI secretion and phage assembly
MTQLYLIAHKVRGEPAFDVAIKLQIGSEEGWIIPTSGHRAYPYWHDELVMEDAETGAMPPELRDHYEVTPEPVAVRPTRPARPKPTLDDLLSL